jgi:hypothetical protein
LSPRRPTQQRPPGQPKWRTTQGIWCTRAPTTTTNPAKNLPPSHFAPSIWPPGERGALYSGWSARIENLGGGNPSEGWHPCVRHPKTVLIFPIRLYCLFLFFSSFFRFIIKVEEGEEERWEANDDSWERRQIRIPRIVFPF